MEQDERTEKGMAITAHSTLAELKRLRGDLQMYATPLAADAISLEEMNVAVHRHLFMNWQTIRARVLGLETETTRPRGNLITVHESADGTEFWVVTDQKQVTGVLLPEEY